MSTEFNNTIAALSTIGNKVGIKDISIDYVKIVEDNSNEMESETSSD